jgi:23S rRNA (cytosine1962-C5)-methyltransferase
VKRVRLKKQLERSVHGGHPWLYRDALAAFDLPAGTPVAVEDRAGKAIAIGVVDGGAIGVRIWGRAQDRFGAALMEQRVQQAFALRARFTPPDTDAYRLIHGEGDRMPGVVCDRYGAYAVLKLDGDGTAVHRDVIINALRNPLEALGVHTLLLREGRKHEAQVIAVWGKLPNGVLHVREHGMVLCADIVRGQKTGLFLDHRPARRRVRELAEGQRVLNLYGYTGGFSVAAALGDAAHVTTVDIAAPAIALAEQSMAANGIAASRHRAVAMDVPEFAAQEKLARAQYDLIVADPPNFAPSETAVDNALQSYEKLHASVLALLAPGGLYLAASCSSHVNRADFEGSLVRAASRALRPLQLLELTAAPADHPRLPAFPEGDYLKVMLLRAMS